jgi:hypothetical protein
MNFNLKLYQSQINQILAVSGVRQAIYPMVNGASFLGGKAAGA